MKVGDIIKGSATRGLPQMAVLREQDSGCVIVVVGELEYSGDETSRVFDDGSAGYHGGLDDGGEYELLALPPVPPLKVGDVIETKEQAASLPIGTVILDTEDKLQSRAASIKVGDDQWLFEGSLGSGPQYCGDDDVHGDDGGDVILHLPSADSSTGRTAA